MNIAVTVRSKGDGIKFVHASQVKKYFGGIIPIYQHTKDEHRGMDGRKVTFSFDGVVYYSRFINSSSSSKTKSRKKID